MEAEPQSTVTIESDSDDDEPNQVDKYRRYLWNKLVYEYFKVKPTVATKQPEVAEIGDSSLEEVYLHITFT